MSPNRADDLAALYRAQHRKLERIVARQVRAPGTIAQDACQTAWARLCGHPDLMLEDHAALSWLITTAVREAWKQSRRLTGRQSLAGFQINGDLDELAEQDVADPCELAIAHREHQQRVEQLRALSGRERLYLYLQGLGYSYREMAQLTSASVRTVERQILRARSNIGNPRQRG